MWRVGARQSGFTLIELMIVLVIIGILMSIAVPAYQDYVRKGRRADAQSYMMDLVQRNQQYFTDNRSYASSVAVLNDPVPTTVTPYYTVQISAPANAVPPSFTITANAIGAQQPDGNLSINDQGVKTPSGKW